MSNDIKQTIRIWDADAAEKLDRIQALPQYKSFNKVINDVVDRGLPILYKELFGGEEEPEEEWEPPAFPEELTQQPPMCPDREFCWTATLLLKEINLNELLLARLHILQQARIAQDRHAREVHRFYQKHVRHVLQSGAPQ